MEHEAEETFGRADAGCGRMRGELLNESLCLALNHARTKNANWADETTTSGGRTRPRAISRRLPTPPVAGHHATGHAIPTNFADHMVLHPRHAAKNLL